MQFVEARGFSEGLAAVRIDPHTSDAGALWGYINKKGELVIPPMFYSALNFSEGVAHVKVGRFGQVNPAGFIDKTGKFIVEPQFMLAGEFSEGLAPVEFGGKYEEFGERLRRHIPGKWGYIDKTGKIMIPAQFNSAEKFSEGLARVRVEDKYGYINKAGQVVVEPKYDYPSNDKDCSLFSEGLACISVNDKLGYIDASGQVVIKPQFDRASKFSVGLAQVAFRGLEPVTSGSDIVSFAGTFAYIDKTGRYVWRPSQ